MIHPAPKPSPRIKKPRKSLRAKKWGVSDNPRTKLKAAGETKRKKVDRQKNFYVSAAWKKLRKAALERAGHRCEFTVQSGVGWTDSEAPAFVFARVTHNRCILEEDLQVHHKTNARFGGGERPEDLQVLCKYHHAVVERRDHPHRIRNY